MTDLFDNTPHAPHNVVHPHTCACGSHHYRVEQGEGPHAAHLRCAVCGKGGLWMTREDYECLKSGP